MEWAIHGLLLIIGIKNGKILKIGQLKSCNANKILNAETLVVCPGFIDVHNHSDMVIPFTLEFENAVRQGITTLIVGNCGFSLAPISNVTKNLFLKSNMLLVPKNSVK